MTIDVHYLADHPNLTRRVATWFYEEWGIRNPENSVENVEKRLLERMNRDRLPLILIAFQGVEPVASASLKIREMETHPRYVHWLGSVYVHHPFRNHGIGSWLVEYAAAEAGRHKVRELYLYTHRHESFYARLGWFPVERPHYHGREVVIMKRVLAV
jgi:GNAT superfamily N-acetyltransferase